LGGEPQEQAQLRQAQRWSKGAAENIAGNFGSIDIIDKAFTETFIEKSIAVDERCHESKDKLILKPIIN
jgi:hypothetical protein